MDNKNNFLNLNIYDFLGIKNEDIYYDELSYSDKLDQLTKFRETFNSPTPKEISIEHTKYNEPVLLVKPLDLKKDLLIYRIFKAVQKALIIFK